jgi:poly-gamma-glutamate synthesis protein (capsule biosynthesis protein)
LLCYEQQNFVLDEIRRRSADPTIDAIVLTPHWGTELSAIVEQRQRDLANEAVSAGALLVIGSHPHIVQEWEKLQGPDKREALVIYSSGDFISRELADPNRFGIISIVELWKGPQPSKAHIAAAAYSATQLDLTAAPQLRELPAGREIPQLPRGNRISLGQTLPLPKSCE